MAPTCPKTSSTLSMKLLVDAKNQRVLYAEAGKDVVDFLFSFLTLPVGTVVKVLTKDAMVGCVGNLYGSVEKLDAAYVRSADAKAALLAPACGYESGRLLQLQAAPLAAAAPPVPLEVYQCSRGGTGDCYNRVAAVRNAPCSRCRGASAMNVPIELVGWSSGAAGSGGGEAAETAPSRSAITGMGFVKEVVMYTVMDDLKVAPMSTISSIAALNALGITDISSLKEKAVRVGHNEGLEILRASLQSKTVLTDVLLGKKKKNKEAAPPPDNKKKPKATPTKKKKSDATPRRRKRKGRLESG